MSEANECSGTTTEQKRSRFNFRGFFSLLLFCSFILLTLSGVVLYLAPRCGIARLIDWKILGISKDGWSTVHITLPLLVLMATGFHLYYNWTIFWGYLKDKTRHALNLKRELALAVLLCVITVIGSLYSLPPFSAIIQWNDDIKEYWDSQVEEGDRGGRGGRSRGAGRGAGGR